MIKLAQKWHNCVTGRDSLFSAAVLVLCATVPGPQMSELAFTPAVHSRVLPALHCLLCGFSTRPVLPGGGTDHKTHLEWRVRFDLDQHLKECRQPGQPEGALWGQG